MESWEFKSSQREGSNVLGLVMFSVILGTTIGRMREKGQLLQDFFTTLSEAMMTITSWVIWYVISISDLKEYQLIVHFPISVQDFPIGRGLSDSRQDH